MFITTANLAENIPAPLRDRMEFIPFPGYTDQERMEIARQFLEPRAVAECGLPEDAISIPDTALRFAWCFDYTFAKPACAAWTVTSRRYAEKSLASSPKATNPVEVGDRRRLTVTRVSWPAAVRATIDRRSG